jgi:cell wall-associated NlpC family hydrolase
MKTLICSVVLLCASLTVRAQAQPAPPEASGLGGVPMAAQVRLAPGSLHPAVELAKTLLGIPYRWAGTNPAQGFDCSGLVYYVYNQLQVRVPRMQRDLFHRAQQVQKSQLEPGDLLFFDTFARLSHVGIYIGDGQFIHAPRRGLSVSIESMDSSYYRNRYVGARRVMGGAAGAALAPFAP